MSAAVRLDYVDGRDADAVAELLRGEGYDARKLHGRCSVLVEVDDAAAFDLRITRRVAEAYAVAPL